jgi:hypothetical protein
MYMTQDLNSFKEIITHAQCSVDEKKKIYIFHVYHIRIIAKKNWFTRHERQIPMIADHDLVKKSFGPIIAEYDLVKKR